MNEVAWREESVTLSNSQSRISGFVIHVTVLFSALCGLSILPSNFLRISYGPRALRLPVA